MFNANEAEKGNKVLLETFDILNEQLLTKREDGEGWAIQGGLLGFRIAQEPDMGMVYGPRPIRIEYCAGVRVGSSHA